MPATRQGTGSNGSKTCGARRSANGATARRICHGARWGAGEIAICRATYADATRKSCGACALPRDAVIGFPAHGAWRRVEAATAARAVPVGQSSAFHDHRTMAEVIAAETEIEAA